jgi:hypothetical protein
MLVVRLLWVVRGASKAAPLRTIVMDKEKFLATSFKIGLIHWIIIGVCLLMFVSPLGHRPGAMHPLLIVPFLYCLISPVPALIGVIVGIRERSRGTTRRWVTTGIALNLGYLVVLFSFVFFMWDKWMGV